MDIEGFLFFMGIIIGVVLGTVITLILTGSPDELAIICTHEGGVVQGEVCVKDGEVLEIE